MLPEEIKWARHDRGLTVKQLARHLNVSEITVNKWERGENKPSPSLQKELEAFLYGSVLVFEQELLLKIEKALGGKR